MNRPGFDRKGAETRRKSEAAEKASGAGAGDVFDGVRLVHEHPHGKAALAGPTHFGAPISGEHNLKTDYSSFQNAAGAFGLAS